MKEKWIKIGMQYERENENGVTNSLLDCDKITRETVDNTIRDYIKSWTGKGTVIILNIETGPYRDDLLSLSDKKYFLGREYKI